MFLSFLFPVAKFVMIHVDSITFQIDTPRRTIATFKIFFFFYTQDWLIFSQVCFGGFCSCFDKEILSGAGEGVLKLSWAVCLRGYVTAKDLLRVRVIQAPMEEHGIDHLSTPFAIMFFPFAIS